MFPALAVAKVLRERGVPVVWLGVPDSMESRLVPANGFPIEWVRVRGIRGKGAGAWLAAPFRIGRRRARGDARHAPRSSRARCSGAGGYVSGPGGIAAWLLRIPLLIHEQNAVAGLTNRWLARFATQVLEAFPGSFGAGVKARTVGNPVRADIAAMPRSRGALRRPHRARAALGVRRQPGRAALERRRPAGAVAARCSSAVRKCGIRRARAASRRRAPPIKRSRSRPRSLPFIDDMAAAYAWADLALCRAGAMTIAELQAAGLGALLVPFAGRHRRSSDEERRGDGACRRRPGAAGARQLTAERLSAELAELTADRPRMLEMARAARATRNIDAAACLADLCVAAGGAAA